MNFIKSQTPGGGSVVDKMTDINVSISAGIDGEIVPDLYGLPLEDAKAQLETLGFVCETTEDFDATIATGCVMKQSVAAGKETAKGSTVLLTVSKGRDPSKEYPAKEVKVIDFVGMTYSDAIKSAAKAELVIKVSEKKYSDSVPENTVMAQSVPADSVITNDRVIELTVSLGKKTVVVPYVIGATEANAKEILGEKELKVTVEYKSSDSFASGLVMSQSLAAKKEVTPGTEVKITVSKGAVSFAGPNVVGKSETSAKSTLNAKGLKVSVTYAKNSSVAEGNVISQTPSSGNVKSGDTVTITVSSGKPSYSVANVVGKAQSDAEKTLKNQGFKVSVSYGGYSSSVPYGSVLSQSPSVGSSQIEGSTIALTLSKGPDWSSYSDSLPSSVTSDNYEIRTQTLYRYKDKETTTSSNSTLSGWTQYDSSWVWGEYGAWSSWSKSSVSSSNYRQVETNSYTVEDEPPHGYIYYVYIYPNSPKFRYQDYGGNREHKETESNTPFTYYKTYYGHKGYVNGSGVVWFLKSTPQDAKTHTEYEYRYRDRSKVYTYYYYKWGNWSNYSTTKYISSDNRQVETKTQYSYRRK